ncbi:MAG: protein translocase SEC61 complex subunit gamma [archaeon]
MELKLKEKLLKLREKLSDFAESSRRIFTVSRKPDKKEYNVMAKITGIGIIIIGVIGFIIALVFILLGLGR